MLKYSKTGTFAYGVLLAFENELGSELLLSKLSPKILTFLGARADSGAVIHATEQLLQFKEMRQREGFIDA